MSNFIHIIPLGLEKDRNIYLLKKFPPYRVYFLNYKIECDIDKEYYKLQEPIRKELDSLISLAEKKYLLVHYEDFEDMFLKIFDIMVKEKKRGNEVIAHIFGPRMSAFATWLAASITNSKGFYIRSADYLPNGEKLTSEDEVKVIELLKLPVIIPTELQAIFLEYLLNHKGFIIGSLRSFVTNLGLEKFGKIKSINSAIVSMSHCIRELKREQFIKVKTISRKRQKIEITDLGKLTAKAYKILKENKANLNSFNK
jgi:predicted transcriptional regulator